MGKKSDNRTQRDLLAPDKRLPIGKRFGRLVVAGTPFRVRLNDNRHAVLLVCECSCGLPVIVRANRLLKGLVESCGCLRGGPGVPRPNQRIKESSEALNKLPPDDLMRFFELTYKPLKLRNRSANTSRLYAYSIRCFGKSLGRRATLADFTDEAVSDHLSNLNRLGRSPHSVEKERCQLLAVWRFACRKGFLTKWPDVQAERLPVRTPLAWLDVDLAKLANVCADEPGRIGRVPASAWWTALHHVLWNSGERIGALLQITWDDITSDGWLIVRAELRKGKREDKAYQLGADTLVALQAIRNPDQGRVFEWDRSLSSLYTTYKRMLKRAGLPTDARSKFHRMRRTVASYFEASGGNSQDLLGHVHRATTRKYLDPRVVKTKAPCDTLFRFGEANP